MAQRLIINLGAGPDTQTGDSVYVAFDKVNSNFSNLFSVFGSNGGTDLVGNTITGNAFITTGNIRTGNLFAYGNIETLGNSVASGFFYPNGVSVFSNLSANLENVSSNIIPLISGAYSLGNVSNQFASLYLSNSISLSNAIITTDGSQLFVNGSIVTGSYGNANVANYLRSNSNVVITTTGNVTAPYFIGNGSLLTGIVSGTNYTNANVASYLASNSNVVITTTGNVTAPYFIGNGSLLTSLTGSNVVGNVTSAITATYVTGLTGTNVNVALGYVPLNSNATASTAQYVTQGDQSNITAVGTLSNLTVSGNVSATYFIGDGSQLTGIVTYTNANVASYLPVYGGNIALGNITNNSYAWVFSNTGNLSAPGNISTSSNITANFFLGNGRFLTGIDATSIQNGTSNVKVYANSNVTVSVNGTANVAVFGQTSSTITGNLVVVGNISATNYLGNAILLGTNTVGQLASNAVTLTTGTNVTDSIAQLNYVLGKLVPQAPNVFPGGQTLTVNTLSTYRMANFVQTDNTASGGKSVAGGTTVSNVRRANTYTTTTIANVGPGDSGTVTAYRNGVAAGSVALTGNSNGTYSNLIITNNQDYHNVVSSVTAGFWYSFSASLSGVVQPGWNEANIGFTAGTNTNTPYWYYDSSAPGTPTWSNVGISLTTNSATYSSTIPHLNSSSVFTLTANVAKLSGDMFPTSNTFVTGSAGGAIAAPTSVTYATAVGITYPLAQNLYVSTGSAYLSTTAAVIAGFGSSSTGPTLTADNSYTTGAQAFTTALGRTVLYKTGTSTQIEETSLTVTSVGTGSGNALRVINPGSTDTPAISANTAFNSQTSTLQTYDATVVAAVLKHDQTNYSTGYYPVGPDLSTGRTGSQYFTMRFTRTVVSKFNVVYSGNIAGLWVALPGSTIDSTSTLNGWLDMSTAYSGSGVPGANVAAGGNGSNGCSLGGVATLNSVVASKAVTATFGTVSSSSTVSNEIFVRVKLTSGQTVTALSISTATN